MLGGALAPVAPLLLKGLAPPPPAQPAYSITLSPAGHIAGFRITGGQVVSSMTFRADQFVITKTMVGTVPPNKMVEAVRVGP